MYILGKTGLSQGRQECVAAGRSRGAPAQGVDDRAISFALQLGFRGDRPDMPACWSVQSKRRESAEKTSHMHDARYVAHPRKRLENKATPMATSVEITFIKATIDIVDNESAIDAVRLFEGRREAASIEIRSAK